ncbi:hypothetical protein [Salibacterium lacus]|uniref:Uncharacterized protein n=1 Tax=Salibacterium lacus TaxID=1898109 RepID=A0ABW5T1X1_9BACI
MKKVHLTKKLTKAQKKAYKPHALPEFPVYRTFAIEKDDRSYYLVGQVFHDGYDHFMQWLVVDNKGNMADENTAKAVHEAYTYWLWAKNMSITLLPVMEKRNKKNPDSNEMKKLFQHLKERNSEHSKLMEAFTDLLKNKPDYEQQVLDHLISLQRLTGEVETSNHLTRAGQEQLKTEWENVLEVYDSWMDSLCSMEEDDIDEYIKKETNFPEESAYLLTITEERRCLLAVKQIIGYLTDDLNMSWKEQLQWHFESTRMKPKAGKPKVSFKGKYKVYPFINWVYKATIYFLIPLEILMFLFYRDMAVLSNLGIQLLLFIPMIKTYRKQAVLNLLYQWKEYIKNKSMVIASFEADNTGSASAFKFGAILAAVIGGIMYAFSREWPLLVGFLIVAVLLYGYSELSARTSLSRTKVEIHEAWIKIGPQDVWNEQIRDLIWEDEGTLKIDQGKDKAAFKIQFKPEDTAEAAEALEKWCEKNGRSMAG